MSEFGHVHGNGHGMRFDSWGVGPFIITDEYGKQYRFEDNDRFGPSLIGKKGDPLVNQPSTNSPFWRVHSIWVQQGRRTKDTNCIWDEPKPQIVQMIGRRTAIVIENGEPNGKVIRRDVGKSLPSGASSQPADSAGDRTGGSK